jgi:hypothetical protein
LFFWSAVAKVSVAFDGVAEPGFVESAPGLLLRWFAATAFLASRTQLSWDAVMASVKYTAPAVRYPFARSAALGWLCIWLAVASGGGVAWYVASVWTDAGRGAFALVVIVGWVTAALGALGYWRRSPHGLLAWDGHVWALQVADSEPLRVSVAGVALRQTPAVILDLQHTLWILVCRDGQAPLWVWLERAQCPERWGDLRRAVYSPAMQAAPMAVQSSEAPSRKP